MEDRNPLVASGECERVYVCELEPGDALATGETVAHRWTHDGYTRVEYADGLSVHYKHGSSTVLVKVLQ